MTGAELAADLWLLLAAIGLNLPVGYLGLPVLSQGAFVAGGMFGTVLLADRAGWPLGVAAAAATAATAATAWLLARGSARLRGGPLALATWALAWLAFTVLRSFPGLFGGDQGLVRPAPARVVSRFLGVGLTLTPAVHVGLAAALCALAFAGTWWLRRGALRLDLAAVRVGPEVAASTGVRVASLRAGAVAAGAALGARAGAGLAVRGGLAAASAVSPLLSLQLYAAVLLGGTASVFGPLLGVALLAALPHAADALARATDIDPVHSQGLLTALLLLLAVAVREPLAAAVRGLLPPSAAVQDEPAEPPSAAPREAPAGPSLLLRELRHRYGGTVALDGVVLEVRPGEVHALVGPNGSGKTTTLRVAAGALRPDGGAVRVGEHVLSGGEAAHVRGGVARTFQQAELLAGLSAHDQVAVGARLTECGGSALRAVLATPRWRAGAIGSRRRARELLQVAGLSPSADPDRLSYGEQRLLPVLRAAATGARFLLLDEPAAGLSVAEVERLAAVVRHLAGNGVGVLLVEHNMRLVARLADRMTVLAEGRVLAAGSVDEVRRDPAVRLAFLGPEALAG